MYILRIIACQMWEKELLALALRYPQFQPGCSDGFPYKDGTSQDCVALLI